MQTAAGCGTDWLVEGAFTWTLTRPPSGRKRPSEREFELNQPKRNGNPGKAPKRPPKVPGDGEPGWAGGLKKLYNSVVDEPLPDSFKELLKKLDGSDDA